MAQSVVGQCEGYRQLLGEYRWDDWGECASALGLIVINVGSDEFDGTAALVNQFIIIREDLNPAFRAWLAWHEIGHWLLHSGGRRFYRWSASEDVGSDDADIEVQANMFAALFPTWN